MNKKGFAPIFPSAPMLVPPRILSWPEDNSKSSNNSSSEYSIYGIVTVVIVVLTLIIMVFKNILPAVSG